VALTRSIGAYDDGTPEAPGIGTTPLDTRKSLSALWASAGVVTGGPSPLVTGTTGFAYSVAGPVPFVTTRGPSDGFQMFTNDGAASVTCPGAPGSGLQRIDIAWVRHPTNTENGDTSSQPIFGVASGTAVSSSPAAPSIPTGALELARNTMTSAATSTASTGNTISQTAAVAALRVPVPARAHAEFTASVSGVPGTGALWATGTMTIDATTSTTPAIATGGTNTVTVTNAGIYAVSFYGIFNIAVSGRSLLNIHVGSVDVAQSNLMPGENNINTSIPNLVCAAGTIINFACLQSSGSSANLTSRVRLTKISA